MAKYRMTTENIHKVPTSAGTYKLYNYAGKCIYLGNAGNLRHRIGAHHQKDASRVKHEKLRSKAAFYFSFSRTSGKKKAMCREA